MGNTRDASQPQRGWPKRLAHNIKTKRSSHISFFFYISLNKRFIAPKTSTYSKFKARDAHAM